MSRKNPAYLFLSNEKPLYRQATTRENFRNRAGTYPEIEGHKNIGRVLLLFRLSKIADM